VNGCHQFLGSVGIARLECTEVAAAAVPMFGGPREAVERLMARAGVAGRVVDLDRVYGWVDRHGEFRMSMPGAVRLARALAAAEPEIVIHALAAKEATNRARGYGDPLWHQQLIRDRPGHALARQWAGHD
jgi:hypothetical protein